MNLNNLFESANLAQQAAIAIAKKKAGEEPKNEGAEFGAYYSEQVAQEIFDKRQDITSEEEVLNQAYHIVANDQGQKSARYMFNYDEDFPGDVVSNYFHLQKQGVTEEKVRLDPKCWTGKKIGNPKTKMKGGVRVNNCVPAESVTEGKVKELSQDLKDKALSDTEFKAKYGKTRAEVRAAMREKPGVTESGMPFRGVGGAFNRGDDERHDLDPTDWYFVKDGKMFAISVYPNQEQQAIALGYSRTRAEAKAKAGQQGVAEGERTMSRAAKGYEKYGKAGMQALAKAGREGKDLDKIRDRYDKYNESTGDRPHDPAPGKEFVSNKHLVKFTPTAVEIYHGGELVLSKPGNFSNPTRQDMYNARRYTTDLFNKKLKQQLANSDSKGVAEGQTPEQEIERLKLRQNAEHGGASLKRQSDTMARIRELEKKIKDKKQSMAEASVAKKPQPYNEPNWAKNLPKEKLDALAGPRYKKDEKDKSVSESGYGRGFSSYNDELSNREREEQNHMDQSKRDFKRQELQHELGHERNNIQVAINGRPWKVFAGQGYADSQQEFQHLQKMKSWAEKKSAATGKKWTVYLTGAEPTA